MTTLLQLIIPAFIVWLLWKAFRTPQRENTSSSTPCDKTPGSGSGSLCDGNGNDGGGKD